MGAVLRRTATALAAAVTFGAAPSPGWAAPGEAGKYLAEAVRDKGLPCRQAGSAKPDPRATSADETAWLLVCSDGRYRVRFMGDASVEVERLP